MPAFQITDRIKQDVRNARMIGEFTVKIGAQKLPGVIWGLVSKFEVRYIQKPHHAFGPKSMFRQQLITWSFRHALWSHVMVTTYLQVRK